MSGVLPKAIHKHDWSDRNYYNYYNSVDTYPIQTTTKKGNYTFTQFECAKCIYDCFWQYENKISRKFKAIHCMTKLQGKQILNLLLFNVAETSNAWNNIISMEQLSIIKCKRI